MPILRVLAYRQPFGRGLWQVAAAAAALAASLPWAAASENRETPIVKAVRSNAPAVVNIQGQKPVVEPAVAGRGPSAPREVNGMGTGVVIDPRGYILTNNHVVDGVRQINVTLQGGQAYVAQLVAHDPETDLAVIRIRTPQALPTIQLGASRDLMTGETVVAVGNAYGYEHTVTSGIISALHRNVQVNETQQYLDLIQTDASINPGNSGGPLLNLDGKMIGLNVAVRAGAQGIGFAIPVDKALEVATQLMSVERIESQWHGITPLVVDGPDGPVTVARVDRDSPAELGGLRQGDELRQIGSLEIERPLDVERALLGRRVGDRLAVVVDRDGAQLTLDLVVAAKPSRTRDVQPSGDFQLATWDAFGLLLEAEPAATLRNRGLPLEGGMRVIAVRPGSSAATQGVVKGDILVQIHRWYTTNEGDVRFVLSKAESVAKTGPVRFDIIRGNERYFGQLALGSAGDTARR
ncbi:MAG: trypsin-like peptidase domain-containing protein [Pirellulales bacterium]|nr:trypsin-like peptidase domain-containing protein [Pirellulales bacterium]